MSNTIYLYLKTHNITGLKYLGKTVQDPFKYQGSGIVWSRHIEKHGYDVTTEILFETTDKEEFKKVGLEYSKKWNIVESKEFANLTEEEGQGGAVNKGRVFDEIARKNMSLGSVGKSHTEETKQKLRKMNIGRKHTEETKNKISENNRTRKYSEETKRKLSESQKNKKVICKYCKKELLHSAGFYRWHNENCKHKQP